MKLITIGLIMVVCAVWPGSFMLSTIDAATWYHFATFMTIFFMGVLGVVMVIISMVNSTYK